MEDEQREGYMNGWWTDEKVLCVPFTDMLCYFLSTFLKNLKFEFLKTQLLKVEN